MFFSTASRLTVTSVGRSGAMPCAARKRAPSPPANSSRSMPVGHHRRPACRCRSGRSTSTICWLGTIRWSTSWHRWRDARARQQPRQRRRQPRQVVARRIPRNTCGRSPPSASPLRCASRTPSAWARNGVWMWITSQRRARAARGSTPRSAAAVDQAVLGIEEDHPRRQPDHLEIAVVGPSGRCRDRSPGRPASPGGPVRTSARAKVRIDVETPLTRGKYTSDSIRMSMRPRYVTGMTDSLQWRHESIPAPARVKAALRPMA